MNNNRLEMRFISVVIAALLLSFNLTATKVLAATDKDKAVLFERLASAKTELEGRLAEEAMWEFWFDQSPTPNIRQFLDAGMERRLAYDYEAAEKHLDQVVALAPDYVEGYNQRAFVRFLRQNYTEAQADLEIAIKLEPNHFGVLSGMYHVMMISNRPEVANNMLIQAVTIHPWIRERLALPKNLWPDSYRKLHDPEQEI